MGIHMDLKLHFHSIKCGVCVNLEGISVLKICSVFTSQYFIAVVNAEGEVPPKIGEYVRKRHF